MMHPRADEARRLFQQRQHAFLQEYVCHVVQPRRLQVTGALLMPHILSSSSSSSCKHAAATQLLL